VVLIELCSERKPVLTLDKVREPSLTEVMHEIRTGRATPFQAVYSWWVGKEALGHCCIGRLEWF